MRPEVALAQRDQGRLKGCTVRTLVFLSVKLWGRIPGGKLANPQKQLLGGEKHLLCVGTRGLDVENIFPSARLFLQWL